MGTNFYWRDPDAMDIPITWPEREHIGKRSAYGRYCWDCGQSLSGAVCPMCGARKVEGEATSAYVELGFASSRDERPHGVATCAKFAWAQEPDEVRRVCWAHADEAIIRDEYGREMTGLEFLTMLVANCPVETTDAIGIWFC